MSTPRKHPAPVAGETFGLWTVMEAGLRLRGKAAARVRCACGAENVATERNIRRSTTRGCFRCAHPRRREASCYQCGRVFKAKDREHCFCSKSCAGRARHPPKAPVPLKQRPGLAERFWAKVAVGSPDACWEWQGARQVHNYGAVRVSGETLRAHRVAWTLTHGEPSGLWVLHRCDNPPCVNPAHLFLGTPQDNVDDKDGKGRGRNQCGPWKRNVRKEVAP